jgi:hypothetical protein
VKEATDNLLTLLLDNHEEAGGKSNNDLATNNKEQLLTDILIEGISALFSSSIPRCYHSSSETANALAYHTNSNSNSNSNNTKKRKYTAGDKEDNIISRSSTPETVQLNFVELNNVDIEQDSKVFKIFMAIDLK